MPRLAQTAKRFAQRGKTPRSSFAHDVPYRAMRPEMSPPDVLKEGKTEDVQSHDFQGNSVASSQ
jgi:hypothetical protein